MILKIAIGQMPVEGGNPEKNFSIMKNYIEKAKKLEQDVIVFPEMCLPGYFHGDIWEQNSFLKEVEYYHEQIKKMSDDILILFGSVGCDWQNKNEDGRVRKYNAVYCAYKGEFLKNSKLNFPFWPKTLLPNYREFEDTRHFYDLRKLAFEKNALLHEFFEPLSFEKEGERISIGISVCEDAWSENYSHSPIEIFQKHSPCDFWLNLSCSPFTKGKNKRREILFSSLAKKINRSIFYVNCTGSQNVGKTIFGFDGSSCYHDQSGKNYPLGGFFEEELVFVRYDSIAANEKKESIRVINALQKKEDIQSDLYQNYWPLFKSLEYTLAKVVKSWGLNKVVVGVSGGIDSALSAVLMTRIFGKENVLLVNMPSRFNSDLTKDAAKQLALNLDCAYAVLPIENSVEETKKQLSEIVIVNRDQKINVTSFVLENIQARDRGARILAALAASFGAVFPCNANKTEATVGYGTLYGDIAGFLCPIGDLWKRDVYNLARFYNEFIFHKEIIPSSTLNVVPSAELSDEQNVLEGKGDPLHYSYHDYLFRSWVEDWQRKTPEDILQFYLEGTLEKILGCEEGLVKKLFPTKELFCQDLERWWNLYQGIGAVKRMQAPPILALSRRAFGFDHREHIGRPTLTKRYLQLKTG